MLRHRSRAQRAPQRPPGEHGATHGATHGARHGGTHGGTHGSMHGSMHGSAHGAVHGAAHGAVHGAAWCSTWCSTWWSRRGTGWWLLTAVLLAACRQDRDPGEGASAPPPDLSLPTTAVVTSDITAGPMLPLPDSGMPFDESPQVIGEGRRLYQWMNCTGCHGLQGGGGIGPPFADGEWIYGSQPQNIFQSIVQGRPDGMPSFRALQAEQVWQIVAYVRSLGPTEPSAPSSDYSAGSGQGAPGGGRERDR